MRGPGREGGRCAGSVGGEAGEPERPRAGKADDEGAWTQTRRTPADPST